VVIWSQWLVSANPVWWCMIVVDCKYITFCYICQVSLCFLSSLFLYCGSLVLSLSMNWPFLTAMTGSQLWNWHLSGREGTDGRLGWRGNVCVWGEVNFSDVLYRIAEAAATQARIDICPYIRCFSEIMGMTAFLCKIAVMVQG